jgi:hypothetical protein
VAKHSCGNCRHFIRFSNPGPAAVGSGICKWCPVRQPHWARERLRGFATVLDVGGYDCPVWKERQPEVVAGVSSE